MAVDSHRFGKSRLAVALSALLVAHLACAAGRRSARDTSQELVGTIVDARTGAPIEGARVLLCAHEDSAPVALIGMGSRCDREVEIASSDHHGAFRLHASSVGAPVPTTLEITAPRYLPFRVATPVQSAAARTPALQARLQPIPDIDVTALDGEGKPLQHGGMGWLAEEPGRIRGQFLAYFASQDGTLSFNPDGVPEGIVTFFVIAGDDDPHFGTATITTSAGRHDAVRIKADQRFLKVRGQAVDAEGSPLAAVVSVEPTSRMSPLDRVLVEIGGQDTDLEGNFEFRVTSPSSVSVRLSTWIGRGQRGEHVLLKTLTEAPCTFASNPKPIVLKAPPAPVVRCGMVGPDARPLALAELGLSFVPHQEGRGHSGSCVWPGGRSSGTEASKRSQPREVRFIWPDGVETLLVTGYSLSKALPSGEQNSYSGEVALSHPTDPCRIRGIGQLQLRGDDR